MTQALKWSDRNFNDISLNPYIKALIIPFLSLFVSLNSHNSSHFFGLGKVIGARIKILLARINLIDLRMDSGIRLLYSNLGLPT